MSLTLLSKLKKRCIEDNVQKLDLDDDKILWQNLKVPGFDDMVSENQLFLLCTLIGNAIFSSQPNVVVFEGPGQSGKSVMCQIICMLAEKNKLHSMCFHFEDMNSQHIGEILQWTIEHAYICFDLDFSSGLIPEAFLGEKMVTWCDIATAAERNSFWRAPIFVRSRVPVNQSGIIVVKFEACLLPNPNLLKLIDINLVEKKCMLAAKISASLRSK